MRLATCLLIPATLAAAQTPLPWTNVPELPWEAVLPDPSPEPLAAEVPPAGSDQPLVSLTGDGTLTISDAENVLPFHLGLSGRPLRVFRDAGQPMLLTDFPARFPARTPLMRGVGNFPLAGNDFRKVLRGLLWILDDGERRITVIHPATHQVTYLPLPLGQNWEITFQPDRLVIREQAAPGEEAREMACWAIPWLVLLPQFMRLAQPLPPPKLGTAKQPFP